LQIVDVVAIRPYFTARRSPALDGDGRAVEAVMRIFPYEDLQLCNFVRVGSLSSAALV